MTCAVDDKAERLRHALVDTLISEGSITSPEVAAALRTVPRHLFAPEVPLEQAYADDAVHTKRDTQGVTISSVSAPSVQALMLEQAQIAPGNRCLEIGSGGYNAALMAELAGPDGQVTTVDIDAEIVERARRCLAAAGYDRVRVVHADAADGVPQHAPYDRIIVTVGVWDVPPAWWDQMSGDGRIAMPLRMRGLSRSLALARDGDRLVAITHEMAGFVALQGAEAHAERLVPLHGEQVGLRFDEEDDPEVDGQALGAALRQPRVAHWSGVTFGVMESYDGLYLWLATSIDRFALLRCARTETARALVDPVWVLATPTVVSDDSFAYLTFREIDPVARRYEFGAYAHGPQASDLAATLVEQIRVWDRDHRHGPPAQISIYPASVPIEATPGVRVIRKRHTTVTISWP